MGLDEWMDGWIDADVVVWPSHIGFMKPITHPTSPMDRWRPSWLTTGTGPSSACGWGGPGACWGRTDRGPRPRTPSSRSVCGVVYVHACVRGGCTHATTIARLPIPHPGIPHPTQHTNNTTTQTPPGRAVARTRVKRRTLNPEWGEIFIFDTAAQAMDRSALKFATVEVGGSWVLCTGCGRVGFEWGWMLGPFFVSLSLSAPSIHD